MEGDSIINDDSHDSDGITVIEPIIEEQQQQEEEELIDIEFSIIKLKSLDEQLGRPKWVVPVRAKDELEMLIRGAITLIKQG